MGRVVRDSPVRRTLMTEGLGLRTNARPGIVPPATAHPSGASNVERLVNAAAEMLRAFDAGWLAGRAAAEIRSRTNEPSARAALARLHELTKPPYR